jgi:signal transduction histidine kinase
MRWLTTPLRNDGDVVAASRRLRAWADALGLDPIARARVVTLGVELARAAASSGEGSIELGWGADSATPWCAIEAPARVLDAASTEIGDAGLHLAELDVVRTHESDRARVRIDARFSGSRESVERAVAQAADASAIDVLRAQNLEMARMLGALRDREADLAHALDALEDVSKKKDELLAVASHDLRSPLAAAKGALDLLEPTLAALSDDQKHLLAVARRGCDAAVHLVDNLLSTAIVEQPDDEGDEPGAFDFVATTREVIDLLSVVARQKGVEIRLDAPASVGTVRGDPSWARRIASNLVGNALKYAPAASGRIEVRIEERDGQVRLSIEDNGAGIPADKIDRVFDKLVRLRPRGTAGERGTGIGLYVTKKLVERLGGSIAVRARDGGGAHFEVRLPIAASDRRLALDANAQRL